MNKLISAAACCLALSVPTLTLHAQSVEEEFEKFTQQQQQEFEDFKNKADAEFETFLREAWKAYDAFAPEQAPVRPEPPKPVTFDRTMPDMPPVAIKPGQLKVPQAPVPGVGEIMGGSQREDDYDKLLARIEEMGLDKDAYDFYLDLRKYGSVRHSGFGLGFERAVMYITGMQNIRDVLPFPRTVGNCEF